MAEIPSFRRPGPGKAQRGNTLCRNNHHRWSPDKTTRFDVQRGRLVTILRCERCGATRAVYT
jgi:hypothetical protein